MTSTDVLVAGVIGGAVSTSRKVVCDLGRVGRGDRLSGIRNDYGGDDGDNGSQEDDSRS